MTRTLDDFERRYEDIMVLPPSDERDVLLARLMYELDLFFDIPYFHDPVWIEKNGDVWDLYERASNSRRL